MENTDRPLSQPLSSVQEAIPVEVHETPVEESVSSESVPEVPKEKKSKVFTIVVAILLLLIVGAGGYYVYTQYFAPEEIEQTTQEDEVSDVVDVSEYTDIKLVNTEGKNVSVSQGDENGPLFEGVVTYSKPTADSNFESMKIVNKKVLVGDDALEAYQEAYYDIKSANIEAQWLLTGAEPWVFVTEANGTPNYSPLMVVKDFEYPGSDYSFAVLSLANGHEFAQADSESDNFRVHIFAIKGENLIRVESLVENLITDLGLSEEDSTSCSEMTTEFTPDENYLTYNVDCLVDIFKTGKYDIKVLEFTGALADNFEIVK